MPLRTTITATTFLLTQISPLTTFLTIALKFILFIIIGLAFINGFQHLLHFPLAESYPLVLDLLKFIDLDIAYTYPYANRTRMPWRNIFLRALVYYVLRATWMFEASEWKSSFGVRMMLADEVCGWVCRRWQRAERKEVHVGEKPSAVDGKRFGEYGVVKHDAGRVLQEGWVEKIAEAAEAQIWQSGRVRG